MNVEQDWKIKLRSGKLQTPYRHFTVIAEGLVEGELGNGFVCRPGAALMAVKTWAASTQKSADMAKVIGRRIGFSVTGQIRVYETEPSQPPENMPLGYDVNFTPFDASPAGGSPED